MGQPETIYITLSGGWGKFYDLLMVITSRLFNCRIVFHHHTYAFLLKWEWLSSLVFNLAGAKTVHVVLCERMADDLLKQYGVNNSLVVSNIAAMPLQTGQEREKVCKIGFIGNITVEKGGELVINLAKFISDRDLALEVVVGGPCPEVKLEQRLKEAVEKKLLTWNGPIYNEQKDDFFKSIDVLVMPTQYPNEAEPLVIWEALGAGVPVISYDRGCISDQIPYGAGFVIAKENDFVQDALVFLEAWLDSPHQYLEASRVALQSYQKAVTGREAAWSKLRKVLAK